MEYHIIDTTLREGEQTPGVLFSLDEKLQIIDRLVQVGVQEIELGISSRLASCVPSLLKYCRENYKSLSLSLWCRCNKEDIAHAGNLRPDILALSIPASDLHIENRLGKDRNWVLQKMQASINFARQSGLTVAVGFEDATRANLDFLEELAITAKRAGASRIRLADTVGIASPATITNLVLAIRKVVGELPVGVHTHNDFGMATANSIAALEAGAATADAVILGLGERTGCANMEELVGYLSLIKAAPGFAVEAIKPLAQYVAAITNRPIPANRPIVGDNIFACESGLHVQGLFCDPRTYEPLHRNESARREHCRSVRKVVAVHWRDAWMSLVSMTPAANPVYSSAPSVNWRLRCADPLRTGNFSNLQTIQEADTSSECATETNHTDSSRIF